MQRQVVLKFMEHAVVTVLAVWFLVAFFVSISVTFYGVPARVVGLTNGLLVAFILLAIFFIRPLQALILQIPLRWLVLYHTIRILAGIGFLLLFYRGALPNDFALVAGWGDILVGATALIIVGTSFPVNNQRRWWIVLLWNIFGLVDIVRVLGTAVQLGTVAPDQVVAITAFPMSLLPTFLVPLVLVTHVLIFVGLWQMRSQSKV